jgi:hypothetical protein
MRNASSFIISLMRDKQPVDCFIRSRKSQSALSEPRIPLKLALSSGEKDQECNKCFSVGDKLVGERSPKGR